MFDVGGWFVDGFALNENLNFTHILACLSIYFVFFWFAVSAWVYRDAKGRYAGGDSRTPLMIAVGVFVLFFPALIFYLAVRPRDNESDFYGYGEGGVNVPMVNFVGKDGLEMTLELNIHKKPENTDFAKDMKIDVAWNSSNKDMEKVRGMDNQTGTDQNFWRWADSTRKKLGKKFSRKKSKKEEVKGNVEVHQNIDSQNFNHKNKNKHGNKKRNKKR